MPEKPLLFISHKHEDKDVADVVATFVRGLTGGRVDVYQSSNPGFEGPRAGKELGGELKSALHRAGVVVLIYTSQDKDWSWCMWECGLAEDPESQDTSVVVLQCLSDKPKVFEGRVQVQAWEEDSVIRFAQEFLREDFFPGTGEAATGLNADEVRDRAKELHANLEETVPEAPPESWATWPYIRLELPRDILDDVESQQREERLGAMHEALLGEARIVGWSGGSPQLFGKQELAVGLSFGELVRVWQEKHPEGRSTEWLEVLGAQILGGSHKEEPQISTWSRFRPVKGEDECVPGVGRVKSGPATMQFDCYFFSIAAVPEAVARMTRAEKMTCRDISKTQPSDIRLKDLLADLDERSWNRIPILEDGRAKYIVHVSMVDRFIRKQAYAGRDVDALTLADLLSANGMEEMFTKTFALVPKDATIAEAQRAMSEIKRCQDVFVTESGDPQEPVLGWLTDRDIADALT